MWLLGNPCSRRIANVSGQYHMGLTVFGTSNWTHNSRTMVRLAPFVLLMTYTVVAKVWQGRTRLFLTGILWRSIFGTSGWFLTASLSSVCSCHCQVSILHSQWCLYSSPLQTEWQLLNSILTYVSHAWQLATPLGMCTTYHVYLVNKSMVFQVWTRHNYYHLTTYIQTYHCWTWGDSTMPGGDGIKTWHLDRSMALM